MKKHLKLLTVLGTLLTSSHSFAAAAAAASGCGGDEPEGHNVKRVSFAAGLKEEREEIADSEAARGQEKRQDESAAASGEEDAELAKRLAELAKVEAERWLELEWATVGLGKIKAELWEEFSAGWIENSAEREVLRTALQTAHDPELQERLAELAGLDAGWRKKCAKVAAKEQAGSPVALTLDEWEGLKHEAFTAWWIVRRIERDTLRTVLQTAHDPESQRRLKILEAEYYEIEGELGRYW